MIKAVIFDMDGVIVNTEPLHKKAYFGMFDAVGIDVSLPYYQSFTGASTINVCKTVKTDFNLPHTAEELVQIKRQKFKTLFTTDGELQLIGGVLDLIKDYHRNGLTLVLASSASPYTINAVFERFDLDQYFSAKFSGAELKRSKPHPEIFLKAVASTGLDKSECMVIEDSTNGIKASHKAGVFCVAYMSEHSKNQDYSLAGKVIKDFYEISYGNIKIENFRFLKTS